MGEISFPDFEAIDGTQNRAKALGEALENLIQKRSEVREKQEAKKGIGNIVIGCFRASYPFANLLITVAKEGAAVNKT